jgi:5-methylthioadenosine/S-adenosylhomocysteine deaminase
VELQLKVLDFCSFIQYIEVNQEKGDEFVLNSAYTTLSNCILITVDDKDRCYYDGMVVICDKQIEYAGPAKNTTPKGRILDMHGKIVMPGLVNTHTHSPSSLFRGFGDDLFLMDWLQNYMWPAEKNLTEELAYKGAALSYLEFLEHGMTTNVDMWYFADAVARAVSSSGLRGIIAAGIFSWPTPQSDNSLQDADDFVAKYTGRQD